MGWCNCTACRHDVEPWNKNIEQPNRVFSSQGLSINQKFLTATPGNTFGLSGGLSQVVSRISSNSSFVGSRHFSPDFREKSLRYDSASEKLRSRGSPKHFLPRNDCPAIQRYQIVPETCCASPMVGFTMNFP